MTGQLTMNTIIHAALRRDLARFDQALAGFPAGSAARAAQLSAAWENFASQLHDHHQGEETVFFPAFADLGAEPSLLAGLDAEHAAMAAALETADQSMRDLDAAPDAARAAAARGAIAELSTVMQAHLAHEERDLEPFAARHASAPRMKAAEAAIRAAHRGTAATFFAWLLDGADPDTTAALRRQVPAPVLYLLTRTRGRHYRQHIAGAWQ